MIDKGPLRCRLFYFKQKLYSRVTICFTIGHWHGEGHIYDTNNRYGNSHFEIVLNKTINLFLPI